MYDCLGHVIMVKSIYDDNSALVIKAENQCVTLVHAATLVQKQLENSWQKDIDDTPLLTSLENVNCELKASFGKLFECSPIRAYEIAMQHETLQRFLPKFEKDKTGEDQKEVPDTLDFITADPPPNRMMSSETDKTGEDQKEVPDTLDFITADPPPNRMMSSETDKTGEDQKEVPDNLDFITTDPTS
eukprot:TRINITY_DN357_c0_g1_i1.p2 TRINITY_DN357_c0_g1~~TRINITY_DN357_c0_g1_i1.p2  ORF type:complete len:187 (+),score=25.37 TRINITY_DN357_c0_g1_i1:1003-1563(+)